MCEHKLPMTHHLTIFRPLARVRCYGKRDIFDNGVFINRSLFYIYSQFFYQIMDHSITDEIFHALRPFLLKLYRFSFRMEAM